MVVDGEAGDVLTVHYDFAAVMVRTVLGAGPDAVVLEPPNLRTAVIAALDTMAVQR